MKIAVCVKQVPSTTARIAPTADGSAIDLAGVEMILNPYDEYAVEEALRVKDKVAGSEVTALTVGTADVAKVLTQAFALGADEGLLIEAPGADAAAAARCAAAALKTLGPDLIFCGRQAIDDDQWLFPGMLAELLDVPHVTAASAFELDASGTKATCRCVVEGGEQVVEVQLPAVISANKGLNEPRVPTLKGRLNAKKKKPQVKKPSELGLSDADIAPALPGTAYAPPPEKQPGKMIEAAAPADAAAELVKLLRDEAKVI